MHKKVQSPGKAMAWNRRITAAYVGFLSACREKDEVLFLFALIYVYMCIHIYVPRLDAFV